MRRADLYQNNIDYRCCVKVGFLISRSTRLVFAEEKASYVRLVFMCNNRSCIFKVACFTLRFIRYRIQHHPSEFTFIYVLKFICFIASLVHFNAHSKTHQSRATNFLLCQMFIFFWTADSALFFVILLHFCDVTTSCILYLSKH